MVVQAEQIKRDEQHPLLKVDTGGGDTSSPQQEPPIIISPGWNVARASKRSWLDRWPEIISACWMTLILLGITFLVFYALGMSAYRRQSLVIVNCNNSKPESHVFFHHIIPLGSYLPFMLYSNFFSSMAVEYPLLHFNVYFLIDDSLRDPNYGSKNLRIFKRFGSSRNDIHLGFTNERDKQELINFQQHYPNFNITVMPLSHYMAMTPLRCKWKKIPTYYIPFYARVFAVWEYGGIGLDLTSLNNQFNDNHIPDRRITSILRQHNDGIEEKKYVEMLNTINRKEEEKSVLEFFNIIQDFIPNILRATLLDTPMISISDKAEEAETNNNVTLSRNYRNKRDNGKIIVHNATKYKGNVDIIENSTNASNVPNMDKTGFYGTVKSDSLSSLKMKENVSKAIEKISAKSLNNSDDRLNISKVGTEIPHVVLLYDFSIFSEGVGPLYSLPEVFQPPAHKNNVIAAPLRTSNKPSYLLSISSDGSFVAATSRHHPFLCRLLTSSTKIINPRFAIEDAMLLQCSGLLKNNVYCNNIYILDI